jgi:putative heme-binding domain-containing protein
VNGEGRTVGPDLTDVFTRWKGDRQAVLRESLDPSYRIEPEYAVHLVVTTDGRTWSGLVTAEDRETISLLANPEAREPMVLRREDIEELAKTSTSMMPKGLLDRFTRDEILDILAFLESVDPADGQSP